MFPNFPGQAPAFAGNSIEIGNMSTGIIVALILGISLPLVVPGLIMIPPAWKLCARAGFPRWFAFAMVIPLANLTLLYFIAFSQWPSELRQRVLESKGAGASGGKIDRPIAAGPAAVSSGIQAIPVASTADHER